MKVKIIKGLKQIGGCITEIKTDKTRIVVDFGTDLVEEQENIHIPEIEGLTYGKSIYDAVLITHGHGDHIGFIHKINKDIPIYVEEKSKQTFCISNAFLNRENLDIETRNFEFNNPIMIKDIKITPFRTDHSWFNSSMFLIEADGKKVLHTGDFRLHGRKMKEQLKNLNEIGKIDLLITEGTCLTRENINKSEYDLEEQATEILKNYNQVFILQSSTNVDRLVSFYKASNRTNKKYFIEDLFTATITEKLAKSAIPNPKYFNNVTVWVPKVYNNKSVEFKKKYVKPMEKYLSNQAVHHDFTMLVKISMLSDIRMLKDKGLLTNACFIYSMWDGYKKQESMKSFLEEVEKMGIIVKTLHTSGHSDKEGLKILNEITSPNNTIIIHTENGSGGNKIFNNVLKIEEGSYYEVK